jgi:hypothetical protein
MIVVSGTVPDDGSGNLSRMTGYGSYPTVFCPVTKARIERIKVGQRAGISELDPQY